MRKTKLVKRDSALLKANRIQAIAKHMAAGIQNGIDMEKLLDQIEIKWGLRRTTAEHYVELILRDKNWMCNNGTIKAYQG